MKKNIFQQVFVFIIVAILLFSCYTTRQTNEIMDSWIGSHKSELIKEFGPPNKYESDGLGGEILIYEKSATRGRIVGNNYYEKTITNSAMYYADEKGILYHWRINN